QHTAVLLGNSSTLNKRGENPPRCNRTTPAGSSLANPAAGAQTIFSFSAVMAFHEALKNEYPSPETILSGEATPGRCRRAPTTERTKGKKTLCWSNKAAGQEPVWCMAKPRKPEREKTDPVKKPLNCCNSSAACRVSENTA
ncbi:hypothetical protein, partial [Pseudoflavonifractor phocaeensis]|uniref:hypothetical protein n=1 Tax=Pseudoflavonifractor phocaeensis TaxID=1870988 RepID=UPI00195E792A